MENGGNRERIGARPWHFSEYMVAWIISRMLFKVDKFVFGSWYRENFLSYFLWIWGLRKWDNPVLLYLLPG